jgi:hypothetical protein
MSFRFGITNPTAVSGVIFALVFLFDVGLGMISIDLFGGVKHFPTIFIGLIMVALIIWEWTR